VRTCTYVHIQIYHLLLSICVNMHTHSFIYTRMNIPGWSLREVWQAPTTCGCCACGSIASLLPPPALGWLPAIVHTYTFTPMLRERERERGVVGVFLGPDFVNRNHLLPICVLELAPYIGNRMDGVGFREVFVCADKTKQIKMIVSFVRCVCVCMCVCVRACACRCVCRAYKMSHTSRRTI